MLAQAAYRLTPDLKRGLDCENAVLGIGLTQAVENNVIHYRSEQ